jgi:PD-(D/E)XK nuclease superfamily
VTALPILVDAPFAPMSPSVAETFQLCRHKEMLNHYYVENEFNENLHKGQAFHNTIRDAARKFQAGGSWPDMDELLPLLRTHLATLPTNELKDTDRGTLTQRVDRWQDDLLDALSGFHLFAVGKIQPGSLVGTEEWVRLDFDHPSGRVRATGRIDLLVRVDSELWVIDIKTGKTPENEDISGPLAMALYVTHVRQAYPDAVVRAYELYPARPLLVEYGTERVDTDLLKLIELGHMHFVETEWAKHKGMHCNWCDHFHRCAGLAETSTK